MDQEKKPSFFASVVSGIKGYFKGMLAGGAVGAITGGIIGAVVTAFTFNPAAIAQGAIIGGTLFASIGALAGTTTGVIKSRETEQLAPAHAAQSLNIAFEKGVSVGRDMEVSQAANRHFQDMVEQRRAESEHTQTRG